MMDQKMLDMLREEIELMRALIKVKQRIIVLGRRRPAPPPRKRVLQRRQQ